MKFGHLEESILATMRQGDVGLDAFMVQIETVLTRDLPAIGEIADSVSAVLLKRRHLVLHALIGMSMAMQMGADELGMSPHHLVAILLTIARKGEVVPKSRQEPPKGN